MPSPRWIAISMLALAGVAAGATHAAADAAPPAAAPADVRIKDLGRIQGWRDNALIGYGLVTGLAGTGDSPSSRITRQALSNALSRFNQAVAPEDIQSRNVAVVMVTAALPVLARAGDLLDVTVTSGGDARSLLGGTLLMTPLRAADGRIYALAQGPLAVGGYRYDANGNVVQKNHPTVGSIPDGATVENGMPRRGEAPETVTFVLGQPDYTTAERVADAINAALGESAAGARDASGIEIRIPPDQRERPVAFLARIEALTVRPDRRARVVINERTGTVVAGGDVRIARVAISHGDLRVAVSVDNSVSQPVVIGGYAPLARTEMLTNTRVDVDDRSGPGYLAGGDTVADLVQALSRLRTPTRDVISILRAVKAAGALHAELIVQ